MTAVETKLFHQLDYDFDNQPMVTELPQQFGKLVIVEDRNSVLWMGQIEHDAELLETTLMYKSYWLDKDNKVVSVAW